MAHILVVDDDQVLLKIANKALITAGHTVLCVNSAEDALDHLKKATFDLMISDINLPGGISGFNLASQVRSSAKYKNLPMIFLSGRKDKSDVLKALQLGIDAYMVKPLNTDILYTKVEEILSKKMGPRQLSAVPLDAQGSFSFNFKITMIQENGIVFLSPCHLPEDYSFKLECSVFTEMKIDFPKMRVLACVENGTDYSVTANFTSLSEIERKLLNSWLEKKAQAKKAV